MEDVAARASVSRALVSIVFRGVPGASEQTRQRVLTAAAELGYETDRRASRLGRSRTRMIGVVFDFSGDFHAHVIDGLYRSADEHDYEVVLSPATPHRSERQAIASVLGERCEGIVLIGPRIASTEIADLSRRMATVVLLRQVRAAGVDSIRTDDQAGLDLLVDHLAGLGHREIRYVDGGEAAGASPRRTAYRRAMARLGLTPQTLAGGMDEEAGAVAAELLLGEASVSLPSAIVAFNDRCALGILHRLRGAGLHLPGDLSLTGFDDIAAAGYRHNALTTVHQDTTALGALAMDRLRARIEDDGAPGTRLLVPPRLVHRKTTAAPPL